MRLIKSKEFLHFKESIFENLHRIFGRIATPGLISETDDTSKINILLNVISAAWISKELRAFESGVSVVKLNGDNSHQEKERITKLFKQGYISIINRPT